MREMNLKSKPEFARRASNEAVAQTQWRCPVPASHRDASPTPQGTPPLSLGVKVQSSAFRVQCSKFDAQGSRHPRVRGHTLIEMIAVVVILAILAAALLPV